jgi:hypothetical protein
MRATAARCAGSLPPTTLYAPLSAQLGIGMDLTIFGVHLLGLSSRSWARSTSSPPSSKPFLGVTETLAAPVMNQIPRLIHAGLQHRWETLPEDHAHFLSL